MRLRRHITGAVIVGLLGLAPSLIAAPPTTMGPRITDIAPVTPVQSEKAQLLTVSGSEFYEGLTLTMTQPDGKSVKFEGDAIQLRRDTSLQVSALLAQTGTHVLVVALRDGSTSEPFSFKVGAAPIAPVLSSARPHMVTKGDEAQIIAVFGKNFGNAITVIISDPTGVSVTLDSRAIKSLTPTSFEISATFDKAGEYFIVVTTPSGGKSNTLTIVSS